MSASCRFLRPCLHPSLRRTVKPDHAKAYIAFQRRFASQHTAKDVPANTTNDFTKRVKQLEESGDLDKYYPLNPSVFNSRTAQQIREEFQALANDEARRDITVTVFGRVLSRRASGSKLVFIDLEDRGHSVQGLCNFGELEKHGVVRDDFKRFSKIARKGDIYSITGHPTRTTAGEISILATEIPRPLAPSLHQIPDAIENPEILARRAHVDFLVHKRRAAILRVRSAIISTMRKYFEENEFLEVSTPIITARAGGASATPFETRAQEFPDESLTLRIAPELFLKRMVIGTSERVYEIGSVFRNEGIDATHNPEFSICEFYEPYATLPQLIARTETLLSTLSKTISSLRNDASLSPLLRTLEPQAPLPPPPYPHLPFISTITAAIGRPLPLLHTPSAHSDLVSLFADLGLALPTDPTLPRLLDELASKFIEPQCTGPTFITQHPEAISPLAKSFVCPSTNQRIAQRVELFIGGREYVNAYEEENSPWEQRRKLRQQLDMRGQQRDVGAAVDENYIEALEWGLPPTGGWGCGVDRLVMLFTGAQRIADVQPFGTLRNVVGLGKGRPE
ncbi:hypothetical protein IWX90DRAFT_435747 [Phyllosticta citrichinensis]|uniref:Lysyl-tRNA synthetase n=1 Tax=Phyllosticta citrichinensis TaxID=1130410 RepID=A0ABR1XQM3_9PEZI